MGIKKIWETVWCGRSTTGQKNWSDLDVDSAHNAIIIEMITEAIPSLIIQGLNMYMLGESSLLGIASIFFSLLVTINGLQYYGYWIFYRGYRLADIPLTGRPQNSNEDEIKPERSKEGKVELLAAMYTCCCFCGLLSMIVAGSTK